MRYRKMSYSYSMVVSMDTSSSLGDAWQVKPGVVLSQTCWTPPTDVYETDDAVAVITDLAGVDDNDLEVLLFDNALVVEGKRRIPPIEVEGVYRAAQVRQGPFRVEVAIPMSIDSEKIESTYERGILRIILPKSFS